MEWMVTYQDVPYAYTKPATLIVEADTRDDAFTVAYDHLSRRGFKVYVSGNMCQMGAHGHTHIREIVEYTIRPKGRVVVP